MKTNPPSVFVTCMINKLCDIGHQTWNENKETVLSFIFLVYFAQLHSFQWPTDEHVSGVHSLMIKM